MIVRDEQDLLPQCLASIQPWVDEICVVDTGSSDLTPHIALDFGASLVHMQWENNFAQARNRSLELASFSWILVIDADEQLAPTSGPVLRAAIDEPNALAFFLIRKDLRADGEPDELPLIRLFRNDPRIRFNLPVHEQIVDSLDALGCPFPRTIDASLLHSGYLPEVLARVDKFARNAAILRELVRDPSADSYIWLKFAQTLSRPIELRDRLNAFQTSLSLLDCVTPQAQSNLVYLPLIYDGLAETLERVTATGEAIAITERGLNQFPANAELLYRRADLAIRTGDLDRAALLLEASADAANCAVTYGRSSDIYARLPLLGRARIALARGDIPNACSILCETLSLYPRDIQARCLWCEQLIDSGFFDEAVLELSLFDDSSRNCSRVQLLTGDISWIQGHGPVARAHWGKCALASDIGHLSRCRIAMSSWASDRVDPASLLAIVQVRDIPSAACGLLLATAADLDASFDPAFSRTEIERYARRWFDSFVLRANSDSQEQLIANITKRKMSMPALCDCLFTDRSRTDLATHAGAF
jgi:tetratricopeptide (TPR) repeat protein